MALPFNPQVMTEIIPYSNKTSKNAVLLAILLKSLPGSIDELDNLILSPDTDPASHTRLSSLRSIIPQCWDLDPTKRPSSSSIVNCIDIPVRMKPSLGVREEPGAVISSLSIPDDPRYDLALCKEVLTLNDCTHNAVHPFQQECAR